MSRSFAVLLLLCLSVQPAFAFNINWQERVQRFSRYADSQAIAQGRRVQVLGMRSQSFNKRVQSYVRALETRARPFQVKSASTGVQNWGNKETER